MFDQTDRRLSIALAILRFTFAMFMAVWVVEKFIAPETTAAIVGSYYGFDLDIALAYAIGTVQAILLAAFVCGVFKTVSYGAFMLMHASSIVVSWQQLITPYEGFNHLFHAGLPALGAIVALFLLRERDVLFTLSRS